MKKLKLLSKISIVLSLLLVVLGIWNIIDGEYSMGFIFIGLAFALSINDWINVFKKES